MSRRDACHWCTRKRSCYEQRGQCTQFVDSRKIRKEILDVSNRQPSSDRTPNDPRNSPLSDAERDAPDRGRMEEDRLQEGLLQGEPQAPRCGKGTEGTE